MKNYVLDKNCMGEVVGIEKKRETDTSEAVRKHKTQLPLEKKKVLSVLAMYIYSLI